MLFNSIDFALFLPVVFIAYWFITKSTKAQNMLLFLASYYFYASWDWRFLFLLIFSTLLDFWSGIRISNAQRQHERKFWLTLSIAINLGLLGVFKYFNFFAHSFAAAASNIGITIDPLTLNFILPVGISFYTFHGLSYIIDVYKRRISPETNFVDYAVFVSFFPLLVAGPIERATHLLPQVKSKRKFEYARAVDGLRQILWGLFKKVVVADQCARHVNMIFDNYQDYSASTLLLGAILFAFQIYGDFSGYSDIALGTARLFGIELLRNFSFPYFSRSIAEFWRRWHISLSNWFRDYLYIPLGGSQGNVRIRLRNVFIVFLVSGFWHGANWTFLMWGFLHATYMIPSILLNTNRVHIDTVAQGRFLPTLRETMMIIVTFLLTTIAWVFFRSKNITSAFDYLYHLVSPTIFSLPQIRPIMAVGAVIFMIAVEWLGRNDKYALEHIDVIRYKSVRIAFYYGLTLIIMNFSNSEEQFIYFQF